MLVRTRPLYLLMFLTLISKVSCQEASLTFVIDNTSSMEDDIAQVRNNVDSLMDTVLQKKSSQISNFLLVTFNDPEPAKLHVNTPNRTEFKQALENLTVGGGGHCPELALSGVKLALDWSLPGSYIYVFTDASAKDYNMTEEIRQLCQKKQSQISFILTGSCETPNKPGYQVYYTISTACSGLTIRMPKQGVGNALLEFVKEDINDNKILVTKQLTPLNVRTKVPFWIDDLTKYAIISASGMNVNMNHYNAPHTSIHNVIWTNHVKVVKVYYSKFGRYSVSVKSTTSVTAVLVTGGSDFYIRHGFSEQLPKSLNDTTPQPVPDTYTRLSFLVTDPMFLVRIKTAQILDLQENLIENMEMPVTELWPNFYVTEPFMPPSYIFKVALKGEVIQTGNPIKRIAKIPITVQESKDKPVAKAPIVKIMEGESVEVARGDAVVLTCKVSAYPEPEITWTRDKTILSAQSSRVQIPYDFISYLKISSATEAKYYCRARNSRDGKQYFKAIDVIIKDPFIINDVPRRGTTNVVYGTELTLNCDVRSQELLQIYWYRVNQLTSEIEHVTTSEKYSISADGTQLRITSIDSSLVGKYSCKVYLLRDPTQKREFSTNVELNTPPKIDKELQYVKVNEHSSATITCKIVEGLPEPKISWQMKASDSAEYRTITGTASELRIDHASLDNDGHYKCIAVNAAGSCEQVVAKLVVLKAPAVTITEGPSIEISYGSRLTLVCLVKANPKPTILWKSSAGKTLPAMSFADKSRFEYTHIITSVNVRASDNYYCTAINDQGSTTESIRVSVSSPFNVYSHPPDSISTEYGTEVNLKCNITSKLPMEMRWYYKNNKKSVKKEIKSTWPYTILTNGVELKISAMDVGLDGEYTCKAFLLLDPNEHVERTTQVQIVGLVPPKIDTNIQTEKVPEHMTANIACRILDGVPKPTLSWQLKAVGSTEYQSVAGSASELRIDQAALANGGLYKCIAVNVAGRREQVVAKLVVLKAPAVAIVEGTSVEVSYGGRLTLECRVMANPEPTILWKNSAGNTIQAVSSAVQSSFEYTHIITSVNVRASDNYYCTAINDQGSTTESIRLSVSSPFDIYSHPPDFISTEYGTEVNLKCNITSKLPMEIRWYYTNNKKLMKKEIKSTWPYTILTNGEELKISAMDVGLDGEYTCKASLLEDPDEHVERTTHVLIVGLVPPKIDTKIRTVKVIEHMTAVIKCKILEGVPKPNIYWQLRAAGSTEYRSIAGSGSELRIEQAALANDGHYKCVAENAVGRSERVIAELVVLKAPSVTIIEGASMAIPYGGRLTLECHVTANPKPVIVWKDSAGNTIPAVNSTARNGFEYTHIITRANVKASDNFSCSAINDQGSNTESFKLSVSSAFLVHSHSPDTILGKYKTEVRLKCDITSKLPMKILWYHKDLTKVKNEIETSKQYTILSNGAELKINSMDVGLEGEYTCNAFLEEDPDEHVQHTTRVQIKGLVSPEIYPAIQEKTTRENSLAIFKCRITAGVPEPTISWQLKTAGSTEYRSLADIGSELRIEHAALANNGLYKCIAENAAGRRERVVAQLVVVKAPAVAILEGANIKVPYGGRVTLECHVTANPEPIIVWKNSAGNTLTAMSSAAKSGFGYSHIITRVNMKASDNYSCNAVNNQGSSTESIRVSVSSPFMVSPYSPDSLSAKYGTEVDLNCNITSKLPMEIRWYYTNNKKSAKKEIKSTWPYTILTNGAELRISAMDVGLDGEYTCKAFLLQDSNEHVERTTHVQIVGLEAPEVTIIGNETVRLGEPILMKCKVVKGIPKPTVSWQFMANDRNGFVDMNHTGSVWHTSNATSEQSGLYKCSARNSQGIHEAAILLTVEVPARIITNETVYEGIKGDIAMKIPCDAIGNPKPNISWKVNNSLVTPANKYYDFDDGALIIKNPTNNISKYTYDCIAINNIGSDKKTFKAYVVDILTNYGVRHRVKMLEHHSIELTCRLPRTEASTVKWFINGKNVHVDKPSFLIENAAADINGNYTCHVSDVYGCASETYVVEVGYAPSFKYEQQDSVISWNGNKEGDLRCDVEARPNPEVNWTFNGKPLVGVSSYSLSIVDWGVGNYSCIIKNLHGAVQRHFEVKRGS